METHLHNLFGCLGAFYTQNLKKGFLRDDYLVKYWGDEIYFEYLIGGDEHEYLEEGRAFEAELFKNEIN